MVHFVVYHYTFDYNEILVTDAALCCNSKLSSTRYDYTIPGVAVRLGHFLQILDEHGINHCSVEARRKELKSCRLAVPSTKQYFLREEFLGRPITEPLQRSQQRCRGLLSFHIQLFHFSFSTSSQSVYCALSLLFSHIIHVYAYFCSRRLFTPNENECEET